MRPLSSGKGRLLFVVALGLSVGVLTSFGQGHLDRPLAAFCNSASAWLVAPFVVGALMATRNGALRGGLLVCLLQLIGYYVTAHVRGFAAGNILAFWVLCALAGGPAFGLAGHIWRRGTRRIRGLGGTALPAAFAAEGLWLYHHELHYESTAVLWLATAAMLLALLARRPLDVRWLPLTLATGLVAEIVIAFAYRQSF